jgi:hypothetical protein
VLPFHRIVKVWGLAQQVPTVPTTQAARAEVAATENRKSSPNGLFGLRTCLHALPLARG